MKESDIRYGVLEAGRFKISIQPCIGSEQKPADEAPFFEVMVSEPTKLSTFYVHLVEDLRFGWFSSFGKFDRPLRAEEVVEYNAYLLRKQQTQPVWKLSRASVCLLADLCQKAKKREPSAA